MISPVRSRYHEGSRMSKEEKLRWEVFVEKVGFWALSERVKDWWMLRVAMMTTDQDGLRQHGYLFTFMRIIITKKIRAVSVLQYF